MAFGIAPELGAVAAEGCGGGQLEPAIRLLGQKPIDLQRVFRLEDCRGDGSFGLVEIAK